MLLFFQGGLCMNVRKLNIEFVRIFAIIMTVTIHVSNLYIYEITSISNSYFFTSVAYNSFSRICVPLFFMISGAFAINKEFCFKRYITRIIKFVFILIFWSAVYYLQKYGLNFSNLKVVILNSFFNANMTSRHLWYMYAIIGINIALPFIQSMCRNLNKEQENLFLMLWIIFSGLSVIYEPVIKNITNTNISLSYPAPIINSCYYLGYFICGHILYKRYNGTVFSKKKIVFCFLIYFLFSSITTLVTYFVSVKQNQIFEAMMWYKSGFTIVASSAIFLVFLCNDKFKSRTIERLSSHSFGIYLVHIVFLNIIKEQINIIEFNPLYFIPLITLLIYFVSLLASFIISKIPYLNKIVF